MQGLNYERLMKITKSNKPYRGSTNRYPIGMRRHNTKFFLVREENGAQVFDIVYGYSWRSVQITKEEYETARLDKQNNVHMYNGADTVTPEYVRYERPPNILGTVYPEGYFKFKEDVNISQGDRKFLSDISYGWFVNNSRRGGMIFVTRGMKGLLPIYRGMRVDTNTMMSLDEYRVIGRKVDRKASRELVKPYESFYKTAHVMCKALDRDSFLAIAKEVQTEANESRGSMPFSDYYFARATELRDTASLDALILYCLSFDICGLGNVMRHPAWHNSFDHMVMYSNLVRNMNTQLYKKHPEVFKRTEYGMNHVYPPSIWGYEIEVNGEIVSQY